MDQSKIAVRYAKACYQSAPLGKTLDEVYEDFCLLGDVFGQSPEMKWLLGSPILSATRKLSILHQAFGQSLHDHTKQCLKVIFDQGRETYLPGIIRYFIELYRQALNIRTITLTSASSLGSCQVESIRLTLAESLQSQVVMETKVNPELIGGFLLQLNHQQYDASVKGQLKELRKKIIA